MRYGAFPFFATWCFIGLVILVSGCSSSAGTGYGVVQFSDGEPVQSGSIEFRSLIDGARYASRIAADGKFALADADGNAGCPPGNYEVVVVQIVLTEDLAAADHTHGRTVPRRYADYYTSGLQATKSEGDTSLLKIVLTAESETVDSIETVDSKED